MDLLRKLWDVLTPLERRRFGVLFVATLIGSVWEAAALGLVVPFIGAISDPGSLQRGWWLSLTGRIGSADPRRVLLAISAALFVFYLLKNVYLTLLTHWQFRFVYLAQAELSSRLFSAYLKAPWTFHVQRNSAELLRDINVEAPLVFGNVLFPLTVLLTELLVTVALIVLLLLVDPVSSLVSIGLLGGTSLWFYRLVRHTTDRLGYQQQGRRAEMIKWVNQGLGAIKETKLFGRERFFATAFEDESRAAARATGYLATVNQLPRFFLETIIVGGLVAILAVATLRGHQSSEAFATIALCGVAAFRLLPAMNRAVGCVANMRFHKSALDAVHRGLRSFGDVSDSAMPALRLDGVRLPFERQIELCGVAYRYPGTTVDSIADVSMVIPKGASVGIKGPSGAGKTTLVDVIVALLAPTRGRTLVDGRDVAADLEAWRRRIGYIPQQVYLLDDTIRRNVAFGLADSEIDDDRVWKALAEAQIHSLVRQLPEGLDSRVGERGVRFSGGERQRLGIARVLYHNADVLVLDEATASLDVDTEREVTRAIQSLRGAKTLIVITHRLSTIEQCDLVYELAGGRIASVRRSETSASA